MLSLRLAKGTRWLPVHMHFFSPILDDANPEGETRTATATCLSSDDAESGLWSIISDILRFPRIGFLLRNELDFEMQLLLAGREGGIPSDLTDPVCSGPYNQVTSQSFSLVDVSKGAATPNN
jgi:hypothetical protein